MNLKNAKIAPDASMSCISIFLLENVRFLLRFSRATFGSRSYAATLLSKGRAARQKAFMCRYPYITHSLRGNFFSNRALTHNI